MHSALTVVKNCSHLQRSLLQTETLYLNEGCLGVNIDDKSDVLSLFYVDDLILMAESKRDLNKKIAVLSKYCTLNQLEVNIGKTKIIIFNKGRRTKRHEFRYNNKQLEIVKTFQYLGVNFSKSGLFLEAAKKAVIKTNAACGAVFRLFTNAKLHSWDSRMRLYESIVLSTLLYGAAVWSLRYVDRLEMCQLNFFKRLLSLGRTTPNFAVRLESGICNLKVQVAKLSIRWLCRLLEMDRTRLPRICYERLKKLDTCLLNKTEYNWVSQCKQFFVEYDFYHLWESQDPTLIKRNLIGMLGMMSQKLREDLANCNRSQFSTIYSSLSNNFNTEAQPYLRLNLPIEIVRTIAQLRASNKHFTVLNINRSKYTITPAKLCTICNLNQPEDLHHIFFVCPVYNGLRNKILLGDQNLISLLRDNNKSKSFQIYTFLKNAMEIRSFIINE
ncbi:uncharacterized protein [Rhodnius prolixus]|uniref:uncharacterized protein n=1 Tax=Rhodnius prolixus TaxID=13249 RepID=UPI003D18B6CB